MTLGVREGTWQAVLSQREACAGLLKASSASHAIQHPFDAEKTLVVRSDRKIRPRIFL